MVAAKLALVGFVVIKPEAFAAFLSTTAINDDDKALYLGALDTSARLLAKIPRLERIAALVHQMRITDGALITSGGFDGSCDIENGGTMLGLALAHVIGTRKYGIDIAANLAAEQLYTSPDAKLVTIFREVDKNGRVARNQAKKLPLTELASGMVLAEDVNVKVVT